jgi:hypothetical protein
MNLTEFIYLFVLLIYLLVAIPPYSTASHRDKGERWGGRGHGQGQGQGERREETTGQGREE